MIGFLEGRLASRDGDGCFLDVGGVGYRLLCSGHTIAALPRDGAAMRLWTHMHVREDALALYGFSAEGEQRMFEALIGVGGVGPKVALSVCSAFTPETFRATLAHDDAAAIATVPGIGKKTAQRIVLELKDRFAGGVAADTNGSSRADAASALETLGYSPGEAREALALADADPGAPVEVVLKSALKVLAR